MIEKLKISNEDRVVAKIMKTIFLLLFYFSEKKTQSMKFTKYITKTDIQKWGFSNLAIKFKKFSVKVWKVN